MLFKILVARCRCMRIAITSLNGSFSLQKISSIRVVLHTEKYFQNCIKSSQNLIVFTILQFIWNQTDVRLVSNWSENGKYNLISVWFNKIWKRFLCVYLCYLLLWRSIKCCSLINLVSILILINLNELILLIHSGWNYKSVLITWRLAINYKLIKYSFSSTYTDYYTSK